MTNDAIKPPDFRGPSALDLLAEFRRRYGKLIESRCAELREQAIRFMDAAPTPDLRAIYHELDSLHYFEPDLHRLIHAFTAEAVKPFQEIMTDAMMRTPVLPYLIPGDSGLIGRERTPEEVQQRKGNGDVR